MCSATRPLPARPVLTHGEAELVSRMMNLLMRVVVHCIPFVTFHVRSVLFPGLRVTKAEVKVCREFAAGQPRAAPAPVMLAVQRLSVAGPPVVRAHEVGFARRGRGGGAGRQVSAPGGDATAPKVR